ncbi:hypothetical protein F5148DRAFT_1287218 [Russula earlei]|uniref:Uncharacterized protein n=1 Tax=Russula earlei TaxID=71964 RepID=A0ACC0U3X6_9AGAM|nr:hypothetical protein F5148DRAFT_1287218 [Russula earlei]
MTSLITAAWNYFFGSSVLSSGGKPKPGNHYYNAEGRRVYYADAPPTSGSSSRSQTTVETPAPSRSKVTPTYDNASHSTWTSSAPTHTRPSYQQPSIYARAAEANAKAPANLATPDHDLSGYRSSFTSQAELSRQTHPTPTDTVHVTPTDRVGNTHITSTSHAEETRRTLPTSARTHASYSTQTISTPLGLTAVTRPATVDQDNGLHRSKLASPAESHQTRLTSSRIPTSYPSPPTSPRASHSPVRTYATTDYGDGHHRSRTVSCDADESRLADVAYSPALPSHSCERTPSPDTACVGVLGSPLTHSRTLSSSSNSDYHYRGASSSSHVTSQSQNCVPDAVNAENMEAARQLREQARRSDREMRQALDRAKSARNTRDYGVERTCKQEANSHESKKKNLNKRAAKIIFRENNKAHQEGTVDLHGLYANEAVEYAKEEIQSAMYRNDNMVCFIVGRGWHADGGVSKLRPALEKLCNERRLKNSLDPENAGRFLVYLD